MKSIGHIKIHLFCWGVFIIYEVIIAGLVIGQFGNFWEHVLAYIVHIFFFYFHSHLLLPYACRDRQRALWRVPLAAISELTIYASTYALLLLTLNYFLDLGGLTIMTIENITVKYVAGVFYRIIFFLFLSTGYYFFMSAIKKTREEAIRKVQVEQLKAELLQSELNHLRAQINPHLLFNTLSFIKYSAKHSPEDAAKAIMHLSSILDFAIQGGNKDNVMLDDEIDQVNHLIELNRLRFGDSLNINFNYTVHDHSVSMLPLALLTLVENIFKHGSLEEKEFPAEIHVETSPDGVVYRTRNLIKKGVSLHSNRTGLENIRLRLEKTFPDKFLFEFDDENGNDWFNVKLMVFN